MAKKTNAEVRKKSRTARIQAKEKELIKAGIPRETAKIYASRDPGRAKMEKYIKEHKLMWNICRYDKNSKYNTKNLIRTVWKKQSIYWRMPANSYPN